MPTGYTAQIADGMTFDEFVWRCARGMGALIDMRDDPLSAHVPERFEPSPYHIEKQAAARAEIQRLLGLSMAEATAAAEQEFLAAQARHADAIREHDDLRMKYEVMLEKVRAWKPPTPDHEGMKKFMIEQLVSSIDFDCDNSYYLEHPPHRLSGPDWLAEKISGAQHDDHYHTNEYTKEVERVECRNRWLKALRDSLKKGDQIER